MYNVHIRRFNLSMFTGNLSREAMAEEHAEELEVIERGELAPEPPSEVIAARKRRFWPYAAVMTTVLVAGLIWFVTFERTDIPTVPSQLADTTALVTVSAAVGNALEGSDLWETLECKDCHGENAEGTERSINVILAETHVSFEAFVGAVRRGPADMHPFASDELSDLQLAHLYAWLWALER